ncbi:MAG: DNA polymerase III subunit tau [Alphaproteobacteria bacterium MarineAlpha5_Bin11]|nr:DNA polymerase III subunit gamma/tau [Pelagibacteraceae bacterium]PPR44787.1 MAG: DNA polymerase III subunit tau [Alphaproteobacteria bacterium MarineAlpha5_Bin11]PPR50230.1 MAG: DNA polymerase III subunit tau [Alphaproteobacteria bacterium MarineAlpha5_Bin10]|tara:strand:- start:10505 stop:12196 length:1692 start_codon:yes stop_codon:yes gene_type:complete
MTYRVLARKYRPKLFSELIGQATIVETLSNAIKLNRVAHAYLLTGVRGIGKTTTARLIARALNCERLEKNNYEPCSECDSCKNIISEKNMDVIEMDAASRTGVEDVREIIENVKYKPSGSKYKIYIIDEVHMLSKNAFNALLKTLEEPPPHIKFLFATTEVNKLPVTILSRCQRFDLNRVDNSLLIKHIMNISEKEKISITKDAVALIVRAADGSVRDALSLLDQAIANTSGEIKSDNMVKMLGLADRGEIFQLLDHIFKGQPSESLSLLKKLYNHGADTLMIFDQLLKLIHFITELKVLPSAIDDHSIPELERVKGKEMADKLSISELGRAWQVLFKGYNELKITSHLLQTSEMIIIRLIFLSNLPPPSDLIKIAENKIDKTDYDNSKGKGDPGVATRKNETINKLQFEQGSKVSQEQSAITKKINSFRELVELFYKYREGILYTQMYNDVKLIGFEEGKIVININDINNKNFARSITKLISMWTGRIWTVNLSDSTTGKTLAEEDLIEKEKNLKLIEKDIDIKKILSTFPGSRIHSVSTSEDSKNKETTGLQPKSLKREKI